MIKQYKFSIIVPIYNIEIYLEKCIQSVIKQKYENWEIILIDDGSSDNCPQICDKYALKDKRIVVCHKKNAGLPAARNTGIRICTGDYIIHLDGDDFLLDGCLEELNKIVQSGKDIYLGNGRYDYYSDSDIRNVRFYKDLSLVNDKDKLINTYFSSNAFMPSAVWHNVYKCTFVQENQLLFSENLTWSEDKDYFFQVLFACETVEVFDYNFYFYRRNNATAMTKYYSLKNVMSNAYVSVKWFSKIDDYDLQAFSLIKNRLSEELIYSIRFIDNMSDEDATRFIEYLKKNRSIMQYTKNHLYKVIYLVALIGGFKKASHIWRIMKP